MVAYVGTIDLAIAHLRAELEEQDGDAGGREVVADASEALQRPKKEKEMTIKNPLGTPTIPNYREKNPAAVEKALFEAIEKIKEDSEIARKSLVAAAGNPGMREKMRNEAYIALNAILEGVDNAQAHLQRLRELVP